MFTFMKTTTIKIRNNTMVSFDELLSQKKLLENSLANLQREKDLKVDKVNNKYDAKIELVLRALSVVDNELDKTKTYVSKNSKN